jgi:proteasome lid subunit RPN8/RPN11
MQIKIKRLDLIYIIFSALEVYKRETLGILFGKLNNEVFEIEGILPYQTASRGFSWVVPKDSTEKRMKEIFSQTSVKPIGDWHSHTQFGDCMGQPVPSGDDIADMKFSQVHIIVSINEKITPQYSMNTMFIQLGKYYIEIGAYRLITRYKFEQVPIICPDWEKPKVA